LIFDFYLIQPKQRPSRFSVDGSGTVHSASEVSVPILNSKIFKEDNEEAEKKTEIAEETKSEGKLTAIIESVAEVPAIIEEAEKLREASIDIPIEMYGFVFHSFYTY
jgi:hypothetical protein